MGVDDAIEVSEKEIQRLSPVFIYEPETRGNTRLHEVIGTTPKGEPDLKSVNLPLIPEDQKIIVEIKSVAGKAYYKPVTGELMQRIAQGNLAASGVQVEANPMFVTFVSPQEKEKLTTQGYRALT